MGKKRRPGKFFKVEIHSLKGRREGAVIKEEVWYEDGQVAAYNLVYINLRICQVDHGRVLGFDNSHGHPRRHFMGKTESVELDSCEAVYRRFIWELHEQWRSEDEELEG